MSERLTDSRWAVKKLGYSRKPWRIIHVASSLQITYEVPYPGDSEVPMPPIQQAGFDRKRDAVAYAQTLDWDDIDRRIRGAMTPSPTPKPTCPECRGTGYRVRTSRNPSVRQPPCATCVGSGSLPSRDERKTT